jgi:hypothetical protein
MSALRGSPLDNQLPIFSPLVMTRSFVFPDPVT